MQANFVPRKMYSYEVTSLDQIFPDTLSENLLDLEIVKFLEHRLQKIVITGLGISKQRILESGLQLFGRACPLRGTLTLTGRVTGAPVGWGIAGLHAMLVGVLKASKFPNFLAFIYQKLFNKPVDKRDIASLPLLKLSYEDILSVAKSSQVQALLRKLDLSEKNLCEPAIFDFIIFLCASHFVNHDDLPDLENLFQGLPGALVDASGYEMNATSLTDLKMVALKIHLLHRLYAIQKKEIGSFFRSFFVTTENRKIAFKNRALVSDHKLDRTWKVFSRLKGGFVTQDKHRFDKVIMHLARSLL